MQMLQRVKERNLELSLLGLLVGFCVIVTQFLLIPFSIADSFQLPIPLWLGNLQSWIWLGIVLWIGAWLLGD